MIFTKFPSLPQEIRDQIWTFTLPPPRIFDVDLSFNDQPRTHRYSWGLRNLNPLPIALQICYDSRAAALRQGFFFEYSRNKSLFFIPETDILYFGPQIIYRLRSERPISMSGLDRVLNFGFGPFRHPREDGSVISKEEYWTTAVKFLYIHMPHLKTLNHISPLPKNEAFCAHALSPLPGDVEVKWDGTETDAVYKPWTDWKDSIMEALEGSEHRPEICGWKLTTEIIIPEYLSFIFDTS